MDRSGPARGRSPARNAARPSTLWCRHRGAVAASPNGVATVTERVTYAQIDPRHHTEKIKGLPHEAMPHVREDVAKVSDPKAQAPFATSAEVCWAA